MTDSANQNGNKNQPPKIGMRIQADKSALFDARDGVTIRVAYDSPARLRVELWRDADGVVVPPDTGNIGSKTFREGLAKDARAYFNPRPSQSQKKAKDTVPHLDEDLGRVASAMGIPQVSELLKEEAGTALMDRLVECVEETGTLFTTPKGKAHVSLNIEGHTETYEVGDTRFGTWLRGYFYEKERKRLKAEAEAACESLIESLGALAGPSTVVPIKRPPAIREQTLTDAISQLKSMALFERRVEEVHLRVAASADGERFYLDLCNADWEVVEIDAGGWRITRNPCVKFVRADGMLPLPHPTRGGSVEDLKNLLNIGDDADSARNWVLLLMWLVQALRPEPQHPILTLKGGEGTAKSFTAYLLRSLVDPNAAPDDYQPPDLRTLCLWAEASWIIALDNISSLPDWLSNALCKLVTGGGLRVRTLYTNKGLEVFRARRPITMNGIADIANNRDLLSRSLIVNLPVITKYRLEREVEDTFEAKRPGILGALLDVVAEGMKKMPNVEVKGRGSRMPDFDQWGVATEEALGLEEGAFLKARGLSEREAIQSALEAEPLAVTIEKFAVKYTEDAPWVGAAQQLLEELNNFETNEDRKRSQRWPKSASSLGGKLTKLASSFIVEGVHVTKEIGTAGKRSIKLYYREPTTPDGGSSDLKSGGDNPPKEPAATPAATPKTPIDKHNAGEGGGSGRSGGRFFDPEDDENVGIL